MKHKSRIKRILLLLLILFIAVFTLLLPASSVQAIKMPFTAEQSMNADFDSAQFVSAPAATSSHIFTDSGQNLGNSNSYAVALSDLDSDGDIDVFVANHGANTVWLNNGTGIFSNSGESLGSELSFSTALGDVDGDGDLDAFIGNSAANKVWLNSGTGSFTDSGQSLGSSYTLGVVLEDMDGDGDLDAFVANNGANETWLNDGTGIFTDSGQSLGSSYSRGVALGDVDGDSDLDAFVANDPAANKVWLNDGSGNFSDSGQSLGSSDSEAVALGDLDGDGDLDAYVANASGGNAQPNTVWLNNSTGTFTLHQSVGGTKDRDIALGDLDGDGDLDAVTATHWSGSTFSDLVWINDGTGNFTDSGERLGHSWSEAVALGDVNGDGHLDLFVGNASGQANKVWLNQSPHRYVATNGNDSGNDCADSNNPCKTIQHAIDEANIGDTVQVDPGTYVENINFNGKNIKVKSTDGPEATIIDGNQNGSVVMFVNGEDANAELNGFTITNGSGSLDTPQGGASGRTHGGGIWCYNNASPTLVNLKITGNEGNHGGGIGVWDNSSPILINVLLTNNNGTWGGALGIWSGSSPTLTNVTISGNSAYMGDVFFFDDSSVSLTNTIIWDNDPEVFKFFSGSNSATVSYSNVQGGQSAGPINWLDGNIEADPLFVDAANGNYRLSDNSPAIGAGTSNNAPNTDIEGNPRSNPAGSNPDMGAYETLPATDFSFSYEVTVRGRFGGSRTITGVGQVSDTDISKLIATLNFNPYGSFFRRERVVSFRITEGIVVSQGDLGSDVYLAEGDEVVAWIKLSPTPTLYASTHTAQDLSHDFSYELKATGTESPDVTFSTILQATGKEQILKPEENLKAFPKIDFDGGLKAKCDKKFDTVCLDLNCTLDKNRTYSSRVGSEAAGLPFGRGGEGYGIVINSMLTTKKGSVDYYFNPDTNCLEVTVEVCRPSRWREGAFYNANHVVYGQCTETTEWTQTQNKGPFALNASVGFTHFTDYSGPIGSGDPNVVEVLPNETRYSVVPFAISPNAAAPSLNLSMVQDSGNRSNGDELWGNAIYKLPWSDTKQGTNNIKASDGVKHTDTFNVAAPDDNTVYDVSWIESPTNSGITYTDRNNDDVVEAGDFKGWMSSLTLGSPPYDFFTAFRVEPPLAIIDSISPNPVGVNGAGTSLSVSFKGHGEQGTITAAKWHTNRPSPSGTTLKVCPPPVIVSPDFVCNFDQSGLAPGQHLIRFQVEALSGGSGPLVSPAATEILRVNQAPVASITAIESTGEQPGNPNPTTIAIEWKDDEFQVGHDPIDFIAQAVDTDGTIASYRWESDRDGFLSDQPSFTANDLSIGMHTITFAATDNDGFESNSVTRKVRVMRPPTLLVHGACSGSGTWFPDEEITESGSFSYLGSAVNVPQRALDPEEVNSDTQVRIYTILGQLIRTATIANGNNHFTWDGTDDSGSRVASGTYRYKLEFDEQVGNLIDAYYPDEYININPDNGRFNVGAQQVGNRVQTISNWYGVPKVNIVAHSLAGVNSRWYMQNFGYQDDVNKVVMLGTANHGITLAWTAWNVATTAQNLLDGINHLVNSTLGLFGINANLSLSLPEQIECLALSPSTLDFMPRSEALQALNGTLVSGKKETVMARK